MAFDTKALLAVLGEGVGRAKTVREAYKYIQKAANVEGVRLPSYDDFLKEVEEENRLEQRDR